METLKNIYRFSKDINTLAEIIRQFNTFDFLYILYILMQCKSSIMKKVSIEMLLLLIKNLPYEQEFKLKSLILSRTLIIFNLLSIYFKPQNDILRNLALKLLKSFLISHVEATNLITNLFPMTLFYHVYKEKKPNPINWLDHEWDNFFSIVLKDTQSTQLIWNQSCRNELLESITVLTSRYESFTDDKFLVHSLNLDVEYINSPYERDEGISGIKKSESLQMENSLSHKHLNSTLNFNFNHANSITNMTAPNPELNYNLNPNINANPNNNINNINNLVNNNNIANHNFQHFNFSNLNVSFYCLNYKEIKFEYQTLKKHVFVWQYYLKKLINESLTPNFNQNIDQPKKFWNKLMNELINTFNENKILLITKTLTLIYKFYCEFIGPFKEYKYFINIFSSTKNCDIKMIIVQLFCVSLENEEKEIKEPNLKNLIDTQIPEHLLNFISELNSIENVKENMKHLSYEQLIRYLNTKNSKPNDSINYESERNTNLNANNLSQEAEDSSFGLKNKDEKNSSNKISCPFLDSKETFIKSLHNNFEQDKSFPLYANYNYIDDSWNKADKRVKCCTLIVRFLKAIMKKYSIVNEVDLKINFPIPCVKIIFFDAQNFLRILSLLYIDNENLILETLDLIIHFMNDPLTYKMVLHSTNTIDILIYFMIKYKSKNIMKFIDNMYYYHNVFFSFDFFIKPSLIEEYNNPSHNVNIMSYRKDSFNLNTNQNSRNLQNLSCRSTEDIHNANNQITTNNNYCFISDDEYDFFENYQNANKFLSRYFPISLIYHLINSDFYEFIHTLESEIYDSNLIWNSEMFKILIVNLTQLLKDYILLETPANSTNIAMLQTYSNNTAEFNTNNMAEQNNLKIMNFNCLKTNNSNINALYSNNPLHSYKEFELKNFAFDPKFKIDYKIISERINCFIYYFDLFIYKKNIKSNSVINQSNASSGALLDDKNIEKNIYIKNYDGHYEELLNIENYNVENLSIHKPFDFKIKLKIHHTHHSIVTKSILQKIKKKIFNAKNILLQIDIEFIIYLKALKYIIKE